ncbi:MAG: hypothetical protein ACM3TR_04225 [Caulobacteraceae bacterium]
MKLQYLYLAIGLATLCLNGFLTFKLAKKATAEKQKPPNAYQDIITFHLTGKCKESETLTEKETNDDTVML